MREGHHRFVVVRDFRFHYFGIRLEMGPSRKSYWQPAFPRRHDSLGRRMVTTAMPSRGGHLPLIFLSGSDPMIFHLHTSSPALANPILLFRLCCLLFAKRRMLLMQRHCVVVPERPGCFCCLLGNASSGTQPPRPGFTIVSLPACTRTCLSSRLVALRGGGQLIPPPQEN